MSNYQPHPRTRGYWLCADGTLLQEPLVEQTPAGRNVRIAGQDDYFRRGDLHKMLYRHMWRKANARGTSVALELGGDPSNPDDEQAVLRYQVGRVSEQTEFAPFARNSTESRAAWIFRHPDMPVYAKVEAKIDVGVKYGKPTLTFGIIFSNMGRGDSRDRGGTSRRFRGRFDSFETNEKNYLSQVPEHLREDFTEILAKNGIDSGTQTFANNEVLMARAIKQCRHINSLSELVIPDTRGISYAEESDHSLDELTLHFDRALQPDSYLQEMAEYAEMIAPADEIVEHWNAIQAILERRGLYTSKIEQTQALEILTGTDDRFPLTLTPVKGGEDGPREDMEHKVILDLFHGIAHVTCSVRANDKQQDVLAYELARERAAITGETDLLDAFMASIGQVRSDKEANDLVRDARRRH